MFNRTILLALSFFPALAVAAPAAIKPLPSLPPEESVVYRMSWLGLPFGEAEVDWKENDTTYSATFRLKTSGVAAVFKPQAMEAEVTGTKVVQGAEIVYTPNFYHYANTRPEKATDVRITYDAAGNVNSLIVAPQKNVDDEQHTRPLVTKDRQDAAEDALTVLAQFAGLVANDNSAPVATVFDGSRLMQLLAKEEKPSPKTLPSDKVYSFTRVPLGGFTPKELKSVKHDAELTAYLRPGHSRLPDMLTAKVALGTVTIRRAAAPLPPRAEAESELEPAAGGVTAPTRLPTSTARSGPPLPGRR